MAILGPGANATHSLSVERVGRYHLLPFSFPPPPMPMLNLPLWVKSSPIANYKKNRENNSNRRPPNITNASKAKTLLETGLFTLSSFFLIALPGFPREASWVLANLALRIRCSGSLDDKSIRRKYEKMSSEVGRAMIHIKMKRPFVYF